MSWHGLFRGEEGRDDVELYTDESRQTLAQLTFTFSASLREEGRRAAEYQLTDFIAPAGNPARHIGGLPQSNEVSDVAEIVEKFKADHDDYNAIMAEALADRLAEAFAECLHKKVREEWGYGRQETLTRDQLIEEQYRGIRPAAGYPTVLTYTENESSGSCSTWKTSGILLTESGAMWPGSSVSG